MKLSGGCLCGDVRYEASGTPTHETICHCTICRRTTGAPMVAWFSVRPADFGWSRAAPAEFRSSQVATRTFCARCGTQLTFLHDDFPDEVAITTASLDDPAQVPPRAHIFVTTKLHWLHPGDGLPEFPEERTDE